MTKKESWQLAFLFITDALAHRSFTIPN